MRYLLSTFLLYLLDIIIAEPERDRDYEVCVQCRKGPRGKKGQQGWPGPQGLMGPQGPSGQNGTDSLWTSLSSFINIYTDVAYPGYADGAIITMDKLQGLSSPDDFIIDLDAVDPQVTVVQDGVYFITYNVAIFGSEGDPSLPISVGVFKDNVIVDHCKYYSTVGRLPIIGQCVIPISAGSLIDIRNLSGYEVSLWPSDDPEAELIAVKASLMMVKVSNTTAMIIDENIP